MSKVNCQLMGCTEIYQLNKWSLETHHAGSLFVKILRDRLLCITKYFKKWKTEKIVNEGF